MPWLAGSPSRRSSRSSRAPLDSVAWVAGRLDQLDERGKAHAAERRGEIAGAAEDRPPEDEDRLLAARVAAHRALMKADEMERRFLLAVLVHLEENPQLTRPELASKRLELAVQVNVAEGAYDPVDASSAEHRAREVLAAHREVEWLEQLVRDLMLHATLGAALPAPDADVDLLLDPDRADDAEFRLGLLLPFLGFEQRAAVTEALTRRRQAKEAAAEVQAAAEHLEQSVAARHAEVQNAAAVAGQDADDAQARLLQREQESGSVGEGLLLRPGEKAGAVAERAAPGEERRGAADTLYGEIRDLEGDLLNAIGDAVRFRPCRPPGGCWRPSSPPSASKPGRALADAQSERAKALAEIERLEAAVE